MTENFIGYSNLHWHLCSLRDYKFLLVFGISIEKLGTTLIGGMCVCVCVFSLAAFNIPSCSVRLVLQDFLCSALHVCCTLIGSSFFRFRKFPSNFDKNISVPLMWERFV